MLVQGGHSALDGLPSVLLYARDPGHVLAVLDRILPACEAPPEMEGVEVARGKVVRVRRSYGPDGHLRVWVPDDGDSELGQTACLRLVQSAARARLIDMSRRPIVLAGAGRLVRHLQHALRKVVEASSATAVFVLTSESPSALDAALLSRAVVVNCTGCSEDGATLPDCGPDEDPTVPRSASRRSAAEAALAARLSAMACGGGPASKRARLLRGDECEALEAPGALARVATEVALAVDSAGGRADAVVRAAAEADHMRAACPTSAEARRAAVRFFATSLSTQTKCCRG
jgi:hypothetical protein